MRFCSTRRALLFGLPALAVLPGPALAAANRAEVDGAAQFMRWLAGQAIAVLQANSGSLEQRESAFRRLLAQGFDVGFIGRFALGRHWRGASAQQQRDYLQLFSEYLLATYSRRLGGYAGERFDVSGAKAKGKRDILVATRIQRPGGQAIHADWRVRVIDDHYKIIDVAVEGVSMAITQRAEFAAVVKSHGLDGLLQALRARTRTFPARAS